jgi:hypothetical protein
LGRRRRVWRRKNGGFDDDDHGDHTGEKGHEATMRRVLLHVADHVRINEPSTVGFFVSQDASDLCVFTT